MEKLIIWFRGLIGLRAQNTSHIPQRLDASEYQAYMRSPAWKVKRQQCIDRFHGRCALCYSAEKLQVHHRTYIRLGFELPEDLTCLCGFCHMDLHEGRIKRQMENANREFEAARK